MRVTAFGQDTSPAPLRAACRTFRDAVDAAGVTAAPLEGAALAPPLTASLDFRTGLRGISTRRCVNCAAVGVAQLRALAAATSRLTTLRLHDCIGLADVSPLASLAALTSLDLRGCRRLADVLPLASLTARISL